MLIIKSKIWFIKRYFYYIFSQSQNRKLERSEYIFDKINKTTVLFFELDAGIEQLYQNLHDAFNTLSSCSACWHVAAQGAVSDRKRNAGASSLVRRSKIILKKGNPPFVKSNVSVPCVPVGKQTLYFFPDKVLIFESSSVGAVSYKNLTLTASPMRFIEDGSVPRDARIIDKTWKFVNKKGAPDKRFNNNRELPIALYEEIDFRSSTGLNERIQASRTDMAAAISNSIKALAAVSE